MSLSEILKNRVTGKQQTELD